MSTKGQAAERERKLKFKLEQKKERLAQLKSNPDAHRFDIADLEKEIKRLEEKIADLGDNFEAEDSSNPNEKFERK